MPDNTPPLLRTYEPGPVLQAVIDADTNGRFVYINDQLVRASHNVTKDIDQTHEDKVTIDGHTVKAIYASNGKAPTHDDPSGLVDYGVSVNMPIGTGRVMITERVNITFHGDNGLGSPSINLTARIRIDISGLIPETAIDQLAGKRLDSLIECKGPLAPIAHLVIDQIQGNRDREVIKLSLNVSNWIHDLMEAHRSWESNRPQFKAAHLKEKADA